MVAGALRAGAAGVSIGRNAFQAPDPVTTIRAMRQLIVEGENLENVLETATPGTP
jgi:class I fructose-bisphosphate aldolase